MGREKVGFKGIWEIVVKRKDGKIEKEVIENMVVNAGLSKAAGLLNGQDTTPFKYIAIGSGTTAPTESDTALESEVDRKEATVSRETTNVTNDTAVWQVTFDFTSSQNICEAGLFDASAGGNMFARQTFTCKSMESGDSLTITYKVICQRVP